MAVKESELYSSLWAGCDELRGGMDASEYKDYVLVLLFIKYVSDKFAGQLTELEEEHGGEEAVLGGLDKINRANVKAALDELSPKGWPRRLPRIAFLSPPRIPASTAIPTRPMSRSSIAGSICTRSWRCLSSGWRRPAPSSRP